MGKQIGALQFSGKVGELVGSRKAANQKDNTIRKRVTTIKNPNSLLQREQRIKISPANNVYRALSEVLNHSFQGVSVGAACHDKFNKLALMMDSGFPYLQKGDLRPIPGEYQVSTGSLINAIRVIPEGESTLNLYIGQQRPDNPVSLVDDTEGYVLKPNATFGELSQDLVAATAGLNDGDQVTFLYCEMIEDNVDNGPKFTWRIARIVIDTQSTQLLTDYAQMMGVYVGFASYEEFFYFYPQNRQGFITAAAAIISRKSNAGDGSYYRSDTKIVLSEGIKEMFQNAMSKVAAMNSYNTKKNGKSSLYLNQASSNTDKQALLFEVATSTEENAAITVTGAGTYKQGAVVTLKWETTNNNLKFDGWYENGELISTQATYSFEIDKNRSFVAVWHLEE